MILQTDLGGLTLVLSGREEVEEVEEVEEMLETESKLPSEEPQEGLLEAGVESTERLRSQL